MSQKHGATWWSGRFLRSLERLGMTPRLKRGHAFFQQGRVLEIEIEPGAVRSVVQDNSEYGCQIFFEPLSKMEWSESLERLAFADLSAAALLTVGRMPPHIEDFFAPSGRKLLPQAESDLELHCTCRDEEIPCKHLAATAYALAEKLDYDPWLLFLLRGRSKEQIEEALIDQWNRDFTEEQTHQEPESEQPKSPRQSPSCSNIDLFWGSDLNAPILFNRPTPRAHGLTQDRMSVPEPKIPEEVWARVLTSLFQQVRERAGTLLPD